MHRLQFSLQLPLDGGDAVELRREVVVLFTQLDAVSFGISSGALRCFRLKLPRLPAVNRIRPCLKSSAFIFLRMSPCRN